MKFKLGLLALTILGLLLFPGVALADDLPPDAPTLLAPSAQLWAFLAGSLVPIITYVLNKHAPWTSEPVKAVVVLIAAAIAGAIAQQIDAGTVGWNGETLQVVLTAIVGAFGAHKLFYQPGAISTKLGGGQNA